MPHLATLLETAADKAQVGTFFLMRSDHASATATMLRAGRKLVADYGSFAFNGQDATLGAPVVAGGVEWPAPLPHFSLVLTGVTGQYRLVAEVGSIRSERSDNASLTATQLRKGRALIAAAGSFAVTVGSSQRDMEMNADCGTFTLFGQAGGVVAARRFAADYGAFTYAGQDAGGFKETPTGKVLDAQVGMFYSNRSDNASLTATTFVRGTILYCDFGTFNINGYSATMSGPVWRPVDDEPGTWVNVPNAGGTWTDA
jgi:hypothetical protein